MAAGRFYDERNNMSGHVHDIQKEVKIYLMVFGALLVLTAITVLISRFHLPSSVAIPLALTVAIIKGGMVVGFFMHLISERQLIYTLLFFVIIFFFGLLLLPIYNDKDRIMGTKDSGKEIATIRLHDAGQKEAEHVH